MTLQDWLPGTEGDEKGADRTPPGSRRWFLVGAGALIVVLALTAVGLSLGARTPPDQSSPTAASSTPGGGSTTGAPTAGPVVLAAELHDPAAPALPVAPLTMGADALVTGQAPEKVPNFGSCSTDATAVQFLPVEIRDPELWLSGTVAVATTASTPAGIGRLGFFFQAGAASTPCPDGAWSTSDRFQASNVGQNVITGYVVLDQAVTSATPEGRPDVFRTLQLQVSNLEVSGRPAIVSNPAGAVQCPDAPAELCAPLG
jgi:hypothetical protein